MTKILEATDNQINAAIARLLGYTDDGFHIWSPNGKNKSIMGGWPNYLHDWSLVGPLQIRGHITIFSDGWTIISDHSYKLVAEAPEEIRARCLAYLYTHYPDGILPNE